MGLDKTQISGQLLNVGNHRTQAARLIHAEAGNDDEGAGHDDGLDQVHGGHGTEAAHRGIADNDHGADDHRQQVIPAEQAVEQLADSGQAGGHIGHEEDQDNQGRDAHDDRLLLPVALGDKRRDGDGVQFHTVAADFPGHQQKIQIGAHGKADSCPAGVSHTAEICKARQAHQQPGTHIGGLRAHSGDQRAHAAAAQIEALGAFLAPAADHDAGDDHEAEIEDDGRHNTDLCGCHSGFSLLCLSMDDMIPHLLQE